jgi:hypothetical protein
MSVTGVTTGIGSTTDVGAGVVVDAVSGVGGITSGDVAEVDGVDVLTLLVPVTGGVEVDAGKVETGGVTLPLPPLAEAEGVDRRRRSSSTCDLVRHVLSVSVPTQISFVVTLFLNSAIATTTASTFCANAFTLSTIYGIRFIIENDGVPVASTFTRSGKRDWISESINPACSV